MPVLRHCCQHRLLSFVQLVRTTVVCKRWGHIVPQALRQSCAAKHDYYRDKTLDDIHVADKEEGLMEFFYVARPTRDEVLGLGGAAFAFFRRVFPFSGEEFLKAALGRAAHVPGFAGLRNCGAADSHGQFVDDGKCVVGQDCVDEGAYEVILRDCHCHECAFCVMEALWSRSEDDAVFHWVCKCGKMTSNCPDISPELSYEHINEMVVEGLESRENNRSAMCVTPLTP